MPIQASAQQDCILVTATEPTIQCHQLTHSERAAFRVISQEALLPQTDRATRKVC